MGGVASLIAKMIHDASSPKERHSGLVKRGQSWIESGESQVDLGMYWMGRIRKIVRRFLCSTRTGESFPRRRFHPRPS